ncbi:MAG: molecular chaperone HtpG, partial [Lachnospiraceae bacterium]|nr:molecular chaperone HtpG [Lachnospiraceae bacterium]
MAQKKGNLSINSENMFPIIKKWLYSDHDIFYREVISNACDAITKLKKLDAMGDASTPEGYTPRVEIVLNPEAKTVKIIDNGLGMTAEEVEEYINQVAFSGASDFLEKYKDKDATDQIIGHFGLGFYSTFMVSDRVDIDTLSYKAGSAPVHWTCDGGSEFEMDEGTREGVGTTVTLHVSDDCLEFCNEYKAREVIEKYCSFMPYEIYLSKENETATETVKESEKRDDDVVIEEVKPEEPKEGEEKKEPEEKKFKIRRRPQLLNDTHPLWAKTPGDCTDEEYKEFYRKVFRDFKEPLFWIHLNMDYPFNLKGILYFPKINLEFESAEGMIKLYNNQVFIADNIKEVIPEYLMLLKGVIDCPDLPLNVSRSALQNDGFVTKISDYISKKVAEKLAGLCKTDKENYDKYWDDISPFIKYGCLKDDKFCDKMNNYILFKDLDGKYLTLPEALEINVGKGEDAEEDFAVDEEGNKVEAEVVDADGNPVGDDRKPEESGDQEASEEKPSEEKPEEKKEKTIYYVTDEQQQSQYINMFRAQKMQAFILNHNIDMPFVQQLESRNEGIHFARIDAELGEEFKGKTSKKAAEELEEEEKKLEKRLRKALKNDKLTVKLQKLKDKKVSAMLTQSEESRRMADMMKMYAMNGMPMMGDFGAEGQTLILNANHPLVKYVTEHEDGDNTKLICEQLYDLARIQNAPLPAEAMTKFVARSNE